MYTIHPLGHSIRPRQTNKQLDKLRVNHQATAASTAVDFASDKQIGKEKYPLNRLLPLLAFMLSACTTNEAPQPTAAHSPVSTAQANTPSFVAWLDTQYAQTLDFSPLKKTKQGNKEDYGELDDVSEAALDQQLAWRRNSVSRMRRAFDRNQLMPEDQLSWDLWLYLLDAAESNRKFQRHRYIFGRNGPQARLPKDLINYQKVDDIEDMRAYISRLNQSGRYFGQYLERAKRAASDGIRAPHFDYDRTLSEIKRVTTGLPFSTHSTDQPSALWKDVTTKLEALRDRGLIDSEQVEDLTADAHRALTQVFEPALQKVAAWHIADRQNISAEATGAWALPNGQAFYQQRLKAMTTLPLNADQIHELGLKEVERIQNEMREIQATVKFEGSLGDFLRFMREDDQFYLPNTDQGRAAYLQLAESYLDAMYKKLPNYFGILPKAKLQVKRVEAFRESAGGSAHYARGTKDGSRPGTFYAHLLDMRAMTVNRLENLSYHEGVPGHHMQLSIQQEQDGLPRFRANGRYTAYSEGWGLYAELLGKEMGGYQDPYTDFGRLSGEIWRAVRLVVDTGIHAKRWTEAQAVAYALANSSRPELSVRSEIRRYFHNPAQATAYKIGMIEIQALRARAETSLGESFDIRDFHDLILGSGPLPLQQLSEQVDRWLEQAARHE